MSFRYLYEFRKQKNLSQKEFCQQIEERTQVMMTSSSLSGYERGAFRLPEHLEKAIKETFHDFDHEKLYTTNDQSPWLTQMREKLGLTSEELADLLIKNGYDTTEKEILKIEKRHKQASFPIISGIYDLLPHSEIPEFTEDVKDRIARISILNVISEKKAGEKNWMSAYMARNHLSPQRLHEDLLAIGIDLNEENIMKIANNQKLPSKELIIGFSKLYPKSEVTDIFPFLFKLKKENESDKEKTRFKEYIQNKEMSYQVIAELISKEGCKMTKSQIYSYASGKTLPSYKTIKKMEEALEDFDGHYIFSELFNLEEERPLKVLRMKYLLSLEDLKDLLKEVGCPYSLAHLKRVENVKIYPSKKMYKAFQLIFGEKAVEEIIKLRRE
ncbi:MAG: helix-turn-helix domain-containing protein [Eubacteriaceae bacterium]